MPLDKVVFNTEAHPFPMFELGKLFKTGWQRKPRDSHGKIIDTPSSQEAASVKVVTVEGAAAAKTAEAKTAESDTTTTKVA